MHRLTSYYAACACSGVDPVSRPLPDPEFQNPEELHCFSAFSRGLKNKDPPKLSSFYSSE